MALDTLATQLQKAIGNVQTLRRSLVETSQAIAREREDNAKKQTTEQGLLNRGR